MLSSVYSVHQKLLVCKYTAINQLIYGCLTESISIYAHSSQNKYIEKKEIPLSKGKNDIKISYISGIALHLSKSHNSHPFSIATSIASCLSVNYGTDLQIFVLPTGLIYIEVSDLVLASWLQHFIDRRREERIEMNSLALKADAVFSIQYIHARCCSLLRLAQQEKLLNTNKIASESIPWLNASEQLYLNHQAERRLINNLVKVVDELEPAITRPLKWEGAALSLLKAFENFWSACRICGTSTTPPEVIMARVGLIMTTRSVLKFLLEEKLGIPACSEL